MSRFRWARPCTRTKTIRRTLAPVWDHEFEFKLRWRDLIAHHHTVTVFNWDLFSEDNKLGDGSLDIDKLDQEGQGKALCWCSVRPLFVS